MEKHGAKSEIKAFCEDSTIYGLRYFVNSRRPWERIFWIGFLVLGIALSILIVQKSLSDWEVSLNKVLHLLVVEAIFLLLKMRLYQYIIKYYRMIPYTLSSIPYHTQFRTFLSQQSQFVHLEKIVGHLLKKL